MTDTVRGNLPGFAAERVDVTVDTVKIDSTVPVDTKLKSVEAGLVQDIKLKSIETGVVANTSVINNIISLSGLYVTLTGAAQQLGALPCESLIIQNDVDNANPVYIGNSNGVLAANAFHKIVAGASISLSIDNANKIWIIGTAAEIVRVLSINKT